MMGGNQAMTTPAAGTRTAGATRAQWIAAAALVVIAAALPAMVGDYRLFQAAQTLVYAIALLGLNLLTGYNGQISLGHGAFYAIGGYVAAILMQAGVPYWATLPIAGLLCLVVGFLFGLPALRLEGLYLALATFALAVAFPQILKAKAFENWTGGVQGIIVDKPSAPAWLGLSDDQWLYYVTLFICVVAFWLAANLIRSRIGLALIAIREHPIAAGAMGINLAIYKSLTFGISAMFTGVAGALGTILIQYINPDSYGAFFSITLLVGVVIGGLASIPGALLGAAFIQFVPNIADQLSKAVPWAIYGMFMLAVMYFMPTGMAGFLRAGWTRVTLSFDIKTRRK
jgi:branched-chain amino acid transport system permease protein